MCNLDDNETWHNCQHENKKWSNEIVYFTYPPKYLWTCVDCGHDGFGLPDGYSGSVGSRREPFKINY